MSAHRAGVVALLGRANAGKSTLLNAILGQKLVIVSDKPQTTRSRILGIHALPDAQIVFVDTPGLHRGERVLNVALNEQARQAGRDCDAALMLVDLREGWGEDHAELREKLQRRETPLIVVGTKLDLPGASVAPWPPPGESDAPRVSARSGEGVSELVEAIARMLPESPPLFPGDDLSDRPLRFLVAELVREAAFDCLEQELPYALAVEVEHYDESRADLVRIRADVIVERESQKPIVIGRGGARIKEIGTLARRGIERLVDNRVHLELFVKVEPRWSRKPARLESLGYV